MAMNPISSAAAGVVSALNRFDSANQALPQSFQGQSAEDPASAVADQITAGQAAQASIDVLGVADRMLKRLLDIKV
jgi:hypothetical protein